MRSVVAFSASFVVFYLFAPYVIAAFMLAFVLGDYPKNFVSR